MESEKITFIQKCSPQTVYNLAVLNDESYIANGIIIHNCRSALIPATSKVLKNNPDLLIENRDFTQQLNQDFKPLPMRVDSGEITEVFKDINKFNDNYRIDQFILDEDLQLRLMKLNLSVFTDIPGKGKTKLDDFVKPETDNQPDNLQN